MKAEEKQALIEVATKRMNQSRKMAEAQKGSVRPRGGIEIDYGINIALMEIALAALTAQPIGYIDPASLKEYRGKRVGGSWSAQPKGFEYNQTLPIFLQPAPAVSVAEMVPVTIPKNVFNVIYDECGGFVDTTANAQHIWEYCRAAILHNIEKRGTDTPAVPEVE